MIARLLDEADALVAAPGERDFATLERYAAATHVAVMQRGGEASVVDDALAQHGLARTVALTVPSSYAALVAAARSTFVATASERTVRAMASALGLVVFELPFDLPPERQLMAWHPRHGADPAHRQLRTLVQRVLGRAPTAPALKGRPPAAA